MTSMKVAGFLSFAGFLAVSGLPQFSSADILEQTIVDEATGKQATGYVLQGSHNMKRFRSGRSSTSSSLIVPPRVTVEELFAPPVPTRPRFGYGSDESAEGKGATNPPVAPPLVAPYAPVDPATAVPTIRYRPPVYREYYYGTPFFSPCGYSPYAWTAPGYYPSWSPRWHSPRWRSNLWGSSHGSVSIYRGSSFSLWFGW